MPVSRKSYPFVTHFIRNLRGGSQPILARAGDGLLYVCKFNNNLQGANVPFNEATGSELYRAFGLAVPSWTPLRVTDLFVDQNRECWIETPNGRLRPDSGLCFGTRFLGGDGVRLFEVLSGSGFKRVRNHQDFWLAWLIDICAGHADNRQAIFRESARQGLIAYFIDNGHLFGGPKGEQEVHFMKSRYLDPRIYENVSSQYLLNLKKVAGSLDSDLLWQRLQALPKEWDAESGLQNFEKCLKRLSTPILVHGILETMVDAIERTNGSERNKTQAGRDSSVSVLFPGIQATGLGGDPIPI